MPFYSPSDATVSEFFRNGLHGTSTAFVTIDSIHVSLQVFCVLGCINIYLPRSSRQLKTCTIIASIVPMPVFFVLSNKKLCSQTVLYRSSLMTLRTVCAVGTPFITTVIKVWTWFVSHRFHFTHSQESELKRHFPLIEILSDAGQTATTVNDHIRVNTAVVTVFYRNSPCYIAPYHDCISPYRLRWNTIIHGYKEMLAYHHRRCSLYTFACINRLRS